MLAETFTAGFQTAITLARPCGSG